MLGEEMSPEGWSEGIVSVPGMVACIGAVSVVATAADASRIGVSSTTFTTRASVMSSTTSGVGPAVIDSSVLVVASISIEGDAPIGLAGAADDTSTCSSGALEALLVCGVGNPLPLFCGCGVVSRVSSTA